VEEEEDRPENEAIVSYFVWKCGEINGIGNCNLNIKGRD
jgi:hypothetical protein